MKEIFLMVLFVVFVLLTGCKNVDFKEAVHKLDDLKTAYCAEDNAERRAALIAAIRAVEPLYPGDGACGVERKIRNIIDWMA